MNNSNKTSSLSSKSPGDKELESAMKYVGASSDKEAENAAESFKLTYAKEIKKGSIPSIVKSDDKGNMKLEFIRFLRNLTGSNGDNKKGKK